jgi:hypothetical protein
MTMVATGAQTNTALAVAAILVIGINSLGIWVVTRLRNRNASYSRGFSDGYDQAVFDAYMETLRADEERAAYAAITDEAIARSEVTS